MTGAGLGNTARHREAGAGLRAPGAAWRLRPSRTAPFSIEILNKAGVAGVYNRASYAAEKRQALDLWAEHVLAMTEGREGNIVSLRRA
jgi:hypothetical protein